MEQLLNANETIIAFSSPATEIDEVFSLAFNNLCKSVKSVSPEGAFPHITGL